MQSQPTIAILGAGNVGGNLGVRLAASGFSVKFGVRPGSNNDELLDARARRRRRSGCARRRRRPTSCSSRRRPRWRWRSRRRQGSTGKIVVDCTNPLTWNDGPVWAPPSAGSVAAAIAEAVPGAKIIKGFNTFGAEIHLDPSLGGTVADVFLAGDDADAKKAVAAVAQAAGFSPVDSGPLRNAAVLENLAVLWIHLALREGHGRTWAFKKTSRSA
jgi:predicted dinucleotide-binding enzyme